VKQDDLIYKITIDPEFAEDGEELGIEEIAFTSNPAIMIKGMAFSSQEPKRLFFKDEVKQRVIAPALSPAQIYRKNEEEEYYVEFTEEEIERLYSKFMSNLNNSKGLFNLEHDTDKRVPAYLLEAWLVEDPLKDKAYSTYGITVPKGTIMMTTQITDKDYYNKLVENDQLGYSIEGFFGLDLQLKKEETGMEKQKLNLPDGEWQIEDKIYVVKDGDIVEILEMESETTSEEDMKGAVGKGAKTGANPGETSEEEMAEDKAQEEMAEDKAQEVKDKDKAQEVKAEEISDDLIQAVMDMVQPKLDELYEVIAELKAQMETEQTETEGMEMEKDMNKYSSHIDLSKTIEFLKK
jgi:hypothetical protein